jgi:hypothetical protein
VADGPIELPSLFDIDIKDTLIHGLKFKALPSVDKPDWWLESPDGLIVQVRKSPEPLKPATLATILFYSHVKWAKFKDALAKVCPSVSSQLSGQSTSASSETSSSPEPSRPSDRPSGEPGSTPSA